MAKREPAELDSSLIQFLLREEDEDKGFMSLLLSWISGSLSPQHQNLGQAEAGGYIDTLRQTTPAAFTIAFLEFLRTESEKVIAAQCKSESEKKEEARNATSSPTSSASNEDAGKAKVTTKTPFEECPYDSDFPVLGVSKTNVQSIKPRRRVNPTPMESPVVDSAFVFAKVESSKQSNNSNVRTRSLAPMKVDMDALMQRCEKRKSKPKIVEAANHNPKQSRNGSANEHFVFPMDGVVSTRGSKTTPEWSVIPNSALSKFKRFATVHCRAVNERLVPSLIGELQYMFQLLSLGQSTKQQSQIQVAENKLFGCSNDCSLYVCTVMEHLGRVLDSVGEPLLSALIHHPMIVQHAPALMMQMKQSLARHQASTLHSFKSYKISNAQTSHLQSTEIGLPVSLPFQAARDSRNHYKSRESQKLYNNRELCRDHFYAIVREAASVQNSFGYTIDDARLKTQENVKNLMNILVIENYPWFTELFLEHLIQVAVCGETDPVVTGLTRQDPMKLQRLHDRLTLGNRSKPSGPSVLLTLGNKASTISDSKGAVNVLKSSSQNYSTIKSEKADGAGMELLSLFPPSLRVYIWIMEAADSYRLSVQMIWSLKSKICKLAEIPQHSRDSAEIGSLLTQRVLSLKALASLLGFLCFSPGVRSQSHGFEWEICRPDPPIDVMEVLDKAMARETVLLTLPWVLDYLQLIKVDQYAIALPYFQKALQALRNVYNYSILDPKNDSFGVPSMCILASLDRFFEFVNLPVLDGTAQQTMVEPGKLHGSEENNGCCVLEAQLCHGLDRIKGMVDASYIQQCCPNLMELRLLLTNGEEPLSNKGNVSKSNTVNAKSLRKITPVHNPKSFQLSDQGSSFGLCDVSNLADNYIQVKLQQSFFEQHQELQRLVDFVVDTIAVNAARAASSRSVPPILEEALLILETTLAHKFESSVSKEGESWQEIEVEAEVENIITSSIQKALIPAMDYAKKHTAERTSEALSLLANPDESPFVLGIAGRIAADAAALAACKKTLANISCDIRKRITQELEGWRQRFQNASKYNAREEKLQEQLLATGCVSKAANVAAGGYNIFVENKENIEIPCNNSHKSVALKQGATCEVLEIDAYSTVPLQTCALENEGHFLFERILCCCAAVVDCCTADVLKVDNNRHLLRVKLAAISTSLEARLFSKYVQTPPGGFDSLIYADLNSKDPFLISETGNGADAFAVDSNEAAADVKFTIERGLAKRCVALALHLCLQSPFETFGYDPEVLEECMCFTELNPEHLNKPDIMTDMKDACHDVVNDDKCIALLKVIGKCIEPSTVTQSQKLAERTSECRSRIKVGGLMTGLLHMWESLVKCGICEANFLIAEFLSSWRWIQALHSEPWKASKFWFQAVKHGIANVLFKIVCMAQLSHRTEKLVCTCFELFFTALFRPEPKQSRNAVTPDEGKKNMQNLRVVVVFIFSEILELKFLNKHIVDADSFAPRFSHLQSC